MALPSPMLNKIEAPPFRGRPVAPLKGSRENLIYRLWRDMRYFDSISIALTALAIAACHDSALVQVDAGSAASIVVSADRIDLASGETEQLSATVLDKAGRLIAGAAVSWTSDAAEVAAINTTGLVEGISQGMTQVHAHIGLLTAATVVVVAAADGPEASAASECAAAPPEWLWCDDFEEDRLGSYFEYKSSDGAFSRTPSVGLESSAGMRVRWEAGQVAAGALHLAVGRSPDNYRRSVTAGTEDYRELYWRLYVRTQDAWVGGGGYKLSRAFVFHSPDHWGQAMMAYVWAENEHVTIVSASGTDEEGTPLTKRYSDSENQRWLGARQSETPIFDADHVGQWYCVEARVQLNTSDVSDGVFQLWIDDQLEAERTDLNWVGNYRDYGLNAVFVENYWNGGSPVAQERYLDNFVVSTERIGCG